MSSSPTPFAVSPSPTAEIRSQAIAKLKRAASLPRNPDGRRALQLGQLSTPPRPSPAHAHAYAQAAPFQQATAGGTPAKGISDDSINGSATGHSVAATPTSIRFDDYSESEELLDQSDPFDAYGNGNGTMMQRSASDSSGFMPQVSYSACSTPTPFYSAQPSPVSGPGPDWAAYQLAQSYLPSISPIPTSTPPSAFPGNLTAMGPGRNTPSPLPTLGELRNLSRSNSAAARANAMNKLTGGTYTPTPSRSLASSTPVSSEEDVTLGIPGVRPSLQRAGTIGIPRMFGLAVDEPVDDDVVTPPTQEAPIPDTAFDIPRPRLQRSFTVSSSNMGEERRSAVGRRMVERLAERRAARQKEEQEVRILWEERRRTKQLSMMSNSRDSAASSSSTTNNTATDQQRTPLYSPQAVTANSISPLASIALLGRGPAPVGGGGGAATHNRNSEPSEEGAFEFESHLNRSVSTRTARSARGEVIEPKVPSPLSENGDVYDDGNRETKDYSVVDHAGSYSHREGGAAQDRGISESVPQDQDHPPNSKPLPPVHQQAGDAPRHATTPSRKASHGTVVPPAHAPVPPPKNDVFSGPPNGSAHTDARQQQQAPHPQVQVSENGVFDKHVLGASIRSDAGHGGGGGGYFDDASSNGHSSARAVSPMSPREPAHSHADHREQRDHKQHKQTPSMSKQIGRNMLAVLRKRSGSRTGNNHEGPTSPGISRQVSDESVQNPLDRARHHAPSGSATPSTSDHLASSTASSVQHQNHSGAASPNFLPRAGPNDPRIHNSKLSPFPGIQALEQQKNRSASEPVRDRSQPPPAGGRTSGDDSGGTSSSHGHGSSSHGHGQSLHKRGVSDDRSADFHSTSAQQYQAPSQSGHSHTPSGTYSQTTHGSVSTHGTNGSTDFASNLMRSASRSRPEIPTYMTNRRRAPPPPIELGSSNVDSINDDSEQATMPLAIKSQAVISRMNALLALPPDDPSRPDFLDDPPRKLLLAQQVLQVVNSQTVKDRYLFLFNDILIIAKPLITQGAIATLDMQFMVKSIVSLSNVVVSGITDEPTQEPPRHPVVRKFITAFAEDPQAAVHNLLERSNPRIDLVTLGSLLFRTHELDGAQLGLLLANDQPLLSTFLDRFHFEHMAIDDALRVFILAVRLPADVQTAEALLRGFAIGYHRANEGKLPYDLAVAQELVIAVVSLNDMLYSTFGFAFPNHAVSLDRFMHSFRNRDLHHQVPDEMLETLFYSIRNNRLVQALGPQDAHRVRDIQLTPSRPPSKLTVNDWSDPITVTIPRPDPAFGIRLLGAGLEFDPPFLDFSNHAEVSFRVRGLTLGPKSMLFGRVGANAERYPGLGNSRAFHVERAFMRHTFQVAFMSPQGQKRKYCFSVPDAAARQKWGSLLSRQIWLTTETKGAVGSTGAGGGGAGSNAATTGTFGHGGIGNGNGAGGMASPAYKVRRAAEAVGLQVLRDALIKDGGEDGRSAHGHGHTPRKASVSAAYGEGESNGDNKVAGLQTGKELVLLARQNSLLPGVLELLQSGQSRFQPPTLNGGSVSSGSVRSQDLRAMMDARRL